MIKLKNKYLCLDIQEPGKLYRGSRFDWTGQIIQITYLNKHTFCATESLNERLKNKQGRGLYNEFGIDLPLGYDDCPVGGKFPKIGVGLLTKKSTKPYDFFEDYQVTPYSFPYSVEDTKAQFFCETEKTLEYAFQLHKRIELDKNTFTIHYTLSNYGKKVIRTNEYIHNFLSINGKQINSNYRLFFPFTLEQEKFGQVVNPQNVVQINNDFITWNSTPKGQFFFSNINTSYHGKGKWAFINLEDKVGIQESTDFNIQKINLWGAAHVVSPEIFFQVDFVPGKSLSWSRTYTVFTID